MYIYIWGSDQVGATHHPAPPNYFGKGGGGEEKNKTKEKNV